MAAGDHLGKYAEGWTNGDVATIVGALDDSFQLDDINVGMISKAGFAEYLAGFKETVEGIRGKSSASLIELSEVLTQADGDNITASCAWVVPGTPIEGAGLIKVGPNGVLSERLTFYTKLS